jgi:diguanylate cyclase (GGDEF)-like protein/PAS domain S-box-containing protein
VAMVAYFLQPFDWEGAHVYSVSFSVRFLATFTIISIITYLYENFRYIYRADLEYRNSMLLTEISERRRIETSLRESEERYRAIYLHAAEGILLINFKGDIMECNPQIIEMLGYQEQDLVGRNIFSFIHRDDLKKLPPQIDKLRAGEVIFVERRLRAASGSYLLCEQSGKKINDDLIILLYRDITERKIAEVALEKANVTLDRLAYFDGLTHIANRRKFDQVLENEWLRMKRGKQKLGLIIADVDYFKRFNDMYGHPAGDACLKSVASELSSIIQRPADLIARYGGEEFVVLLPDTDCEGCRQIAEKMRKKIEELHIGHQGAPVHSIVTMSFGVAVTSPEGLMTSAEFMAEADHALYKAKEGGRNRVC